MAARTTGKQVAALTAALQDDDPLARVAAALNLGLLGGQSEEAVSALAAALGDGESSVRKADVLGLGYLGGPEAEGHLLPPLRTATGASGKWRPRRCTSWPGTGPHRKRREGREAGREDAPGCYLGRSHWPTPAKAEGIKTARRPVPAAYPAPAGRPAP